jgi:hypothetical protein
MQDRRVSTGVPVQPQLKRGAAAAAIDARLALRTPCTTSIAVLDHREPQQIAPDHCPLGKGLARRRQARVSAESATR